MYFAVFRCIREYQMTGVTSVMDIACIKDLILYKSLVSVFNAQQCGRISYLYSSGTAARQLPCRCLVDTLTHIVLPPRTSAAAAAMIHAHDKTIKVLDNKRT